MGLEWAMAHDSFILGLRLLQRAINRIISLLCVASAYRCLAALLA